MPTRGPRSTAARAHREGQGVEGLRGRTTCCPRSPKSQHPRRQSSFDPAGLPARAAAAARAWRSIRSSCHWQSRMMPSRTWRRSCRAFSRSSPASSSISETRQQAFFAPASQLGHGPPSRRRPPAAAGPRRPRPAAPRGQGARQQDVAALIIDLDDQLLALGPDLDLVLLREGQPDVERVAAALLLHLDRPLLEEDARWGRASPKTSLRELVQQRQADHLAVEQPRLEEGQGLEGLRAPPPGGRPGCRTSCRSTPSAPPAAARGWRPPRPRGSRRGSGRCRAAATR